MSAVRRKFGLGVLAAAGASCAALAVPAIAFGQPPGTPSSTGAVTGFGDATAFGAPDAGQLGSPITGLAPTPSGHGYWLVGADGGVFTYGDAGFFGSDAGQGVPSPFVGIAPTPDGGGYWLAGDFGNLDSFGDAANLEGPGPEIDAPVVGIAATHSGMGVWLAASDGGVFTSGNAPFYGSMGGIPLNSPVVGMASTPDGHGYWLVAADGGIFSFGDAQFYGSMGGVRLNSPVVGMASTRDGHGYWLVAADGGVFSFGDARFQGSLGATPPPANTPVVGMASMPTGNGYWVTTTAKALPETGAVPSVLSHCNIPGSAPEVRPSTILLACGDGNAFLEHLTWSSWTATGASGVGVFTHNTCTPDCAHGQFVSLPPAPVRLSNPIETSAGKEFSTITYTQPVNPGGLTTLTMVIPTNAG